MNIINPSVKLNNLAVSRVWAKLERVDGKGAYSFLVNPEEIAWSHQAELNSLPVLYTAQPLVNYKSSVSTLNIPKLYFWTPGHSGDLTATLAALKAMTKPPAPGLELPLVKLTWGSLIEPRLYLKSFSYREKQWRSGRVTQAEGNMEFAIAPEPPKPQYQATPGAKPKATKLTDREREDYKTKILTKLKASKNLAKQLDIKDTQSISIDADGQVSATTSKGKAQPIGKLEDLLGQIKPGNKNIK